MATAEVTLIEKEVTADLKATLKAGKKHSDAMHQVMLAKFAKLTEELKGLLVDSASVTAKEQAQPAPAQSTPDLPTTFTVGDRTYEVLSFLEGTETSINGHVMRERGVKLKANMGKEDGEYIHEHGDEIPPEYRGKILLVFPDWRDPHGSATYLRWLGVRWIQRWYWLDRGLWPGRDRLVRRVSSSGT